MPGSGGKTPGEGAPVPGAPGSIPGSPNTVRIGDIASGSLNAGFTNVQWEGLVELESRMLEYGQELQQRRRDIINQLAGDMENWAQEHAPWQDQTGDARSGLHSWAQHDEGAMVSSAYIAHGVDYGLSLETMQGGRFQIILPTILHFAEHLSEVEVG